jgi:hypothetical protein
MPSPNAGARGASITDVVAITTGRDADKSSPDEGRGRHSADDPDAPAIPIRQIPEASTPPVLTIWFARHVVTTEAIVSRGARAAEGPLQRSSPRPHPRDRKRGEPAARLPAEAAAGRLRSPRAVRTTHYPGDAAVRRGRQEQLSAWQCARPAATFADESFVALRSRRSRGSTNERERVHPRPDA